MAEFWNPTPSETGSPPEVFALACNNVAGYPFLIAAGKKGIKVWGLTTNTAHPDLSTHLRPGEAAEAATRSTTRVVMRNLVVVARQTHEWAISVNAVACTILDGRPVAITGQGTKVRVWDLTTGLERATFSSRTGLVRAIACTVLNGRPVAVAGVGITVKVWDLATGQERAVLKDLRRTVVPSHWVRAVACTILDGRPVAVVGQGAEVRIWDLTNGQERATLVGHADTVKAVACSVLDGRPIAVTGGDDRVVRIWDLTDEKATAILCLPYRVAAVSVGPDQSLVAGSWQEVIVFERNPHNSGSCATPAAAPTRRLSFRERWRSGTTWP